MISFIDSSCSLAGIRFASLSMYLPFSCNGWTQQLHATGWSAHACPWLTVLIDASNLPHVFFLHKSDTAAKRKLACPKIMQHNRCINGFATNSYNRTYVITVRHHLGYEGSIFYDSDIAAIVGEIRFELQPATHTPLPRNPSRTSPLVKINKWLPFGTCNATSTTSTTKPETEIWYELFLLDFLRNAIFVNSIYTMFAITNPIIQIPRFLPLLWPSTSYWKFDYPFHTTLPNEFQTCILSFLPEPHLSYKAFEWQYNSVFDLCKAQVPCTKFLTGETVFATSKPPNHCFILSLGDVDAVAENAIAFLGCVFNRFWRVFFKDAFLTDFGVFFLRMRF